MKTLVIGASVNKERFSNKAILRLVEYGHEVYAIGNKKGKISNVLISTDFLKIENGYNNVLDTIGIWNF